MDQQEKAAPRGSLVGEALATAEQKAILFLNLHRALATIQKKPELQGQLLDAVEKELAPFLSKITKVDILK